MTTKKQATKLDRKTTARVDAMVIRCADAKVKESCQSLIEVLAAKGITVTFDQLEWSVQKLGLKWRDVFLPATRLERGYAGPPGSKTQEPASGPDMRAVLDRIEQLEQTLTDSGLAEYRGLLQQAQTEAQLAKDRAAAMRADIRMVLEQLDRILKRQDILYNIVGSVRLEHDRQKAAAARALLQDVEDASTQEPQP
jgi:hypothetical protein